MIYVGTDGKVYFGVYPGVVVTVASPGTYNNGAWHYVTATFNASTSISNMLLYVDGVLVGTQSCGTPQVYGGYWKLSGTNIGGWTNVTNVYFQGNIAMAQVYNRPLSAAEIAENYTQTRGRFGV
jgi:hypothetical protein